MLLLSETLTIRSDEIVAALRAINPEFSGHIEVTQQASGGAFLVTLGERLFTVLILSAPVPDGALDRATTHNILWPAAREVLAGHRAHMIVASLETPESLDASLALATDVTWLSAALSQRAQALGVYWVSSETAYEPGQLLRDAAALGKGQWPVNLWVRLHFFSANDKADALGCYTFGLQAFIGREIEFSPVVLPSSLVAGRVLGLVQYLLDRGPVLNDGDTLGVSASERISARLRDKGAYSSRPIYALTLEQKDQSAGE